MCHKCWTLFFPWPHRPTSPHRAYPPLATSTADTSTHTASSTQRTSMQVAVPRAATCWTNSKTSSPEMFDPSASITLLPSPPPSLPNQPCTKMKFAMWHRISRLALEQQHLRYKFCCQVAAARSVDIILQETDSGVV